MSARHQLPFAQIDRFERARLYRLEIGRLLNEARSGHVDLRSNAADIRAAAAGLEAAEWCIAEDLAASLPQTISRKRRVKRPRLVARMEITESGEP